MKSFVAIILAACVLGAYAQSNQSSENSSLTELEAACTNAYNQAMQVYQQQVGMMISSCLTAESSNSQNALSSQRSCVSSTMSNAKENFSDTINTYNKCLSNVLN